MTDRQPNRDRDAERSWLDTLIGELDSAETALIDVDRLDPERRRLTVGDAFERMRRAIRERERELRAAWLRGEIASRLVGVQPAEIDDAIGDSLEQLAAFLGADRASIVRPTPDGGGFSEEGVRTAGDQGSSPHRAGGVARSGDELRALSEAVGEGKAIFVRSSSTTGAGPVRLQQHLAGIGVDALIGIPLRRGEEMLGLLAIEALDGAPAAERWTETDVAVAAEIGAIFAEAVGRRDTESRLHLLATSAKHSPASVVIADQDGRIEWMNEQAASSLPEGAAEDGNTWADVFHSPNDESSEGFRHRLLEERRWSGELQVAAKNGESRYESAVVVRVDDPFDEKARLVKLGIDISEAKRTAAQLARFKVALDQTYDAVFLFDPDSQEIHYANDGASEQLGYSTDELRGMQFSSLLEGVDEDALRDLLDPLVEGARNIARVEVRHRGRSGDQVPVDLQLQIVGHDAESRSVVAISRNIESRLRVERQLRVARDRAADASQAKSKFLASMSHELRTPLNGILGFADILAQETFGPLNERQLRYAKNIGDSGRHLLQLVNEILDLSKIEAGRMTLTREWLPIGAIFDEIEPVATKLAEEGGAELTFDIADPDVELYVDRGRMRQILYNLLSNAAKFTPEGGSIVCTARAVDGACRIVVQDDGIGISEEDQARLFREFEQIEPRQGTKPEGTGLGLAVTKRLVGLHGGSIDVRSAEGEGSTFTVTLPLVRHQVELEESFETDDPGAPLALVVEDDRMAAELLCEHLRSVGVRTVATASGTEAVELAKECRPSVIILDIMLPDSDGWTTLKTLRAHKETETIPAIVASVLEDGPHEMRSEASAYLVKPFERAELLECLGRAGVRTLDLWGRQIALFGTDRTMTRALRSELARSGCVVHEAGRGMEDDAVPDVGDLNCGVVDLGGLTGDEADDLAARLASSGKMPVVALREEDQVIHPAWEEHALLVDRFHIGRSPHAIIEPVYQAVSMAAERPPPGTAREGTGQR